MPTRRRPRRTRPTTNAMNGSCSAREASKTSTNRQNHASKIVELLLQLSILGNESCICWANEDDVTIHPPPPATKEEVHLPGTTQTISQIDLSCDAFRDFCLSPSNGFCDSELGYDIPGCERGDCIDCQVFCGQYDYDCDGCISSGCYWCPGDAKCYNTDLYMFAGENSTSCTNQLDYVHRTSPISHNNNICTEPENFFR